VGQTREGLVGIGFTSTGRAAQRLEGFDCVRTLCEPLLVNRALGLRLAWLGVDEPPALGNATIARGHHAIALARRARRHGLEIGLGQDGLSFVHGRWNAREPLEAGLGQLGQILGALERTVGSEIGGVDRGVELRHVVTDDLAERCAIMTMATQGLPQHWDTSLVLHDQRQPHLGEVRAMIPTLAVGDVHDLCVRRLRAVRAAIDRKTRRIEMAARARQPQPRSRRGGNEAGECRRPKVVEGVEGAPEGVIMEMARLHAGGHEARERLILEKMGDEVALLVDKAEAVEPHGVDGMADGHKPPLRVLLGGAINDFRDAECFKHARDQTQVI
jgi:hypothetical protein